MAKETHFRYRLFDDPLIPAERMGINGHILLKPTTDSPNWISASSRLPALDAEIRRKTNPTGKVEYEEYNPYKPEEVYYKPQLNDPDRSYSRDDLMKMTLMALRDIAERLQVNVLGKKPDALVRLIIDAQDRYEASKQGKEEKDSIQTKGEQSTQGDGEGVDGQVQSTTPGPDTQAQAQVHTQQTPPGSTSTSPPEPQLSDSVPGEDAVTQAPIAEEKSDTSPLAE